MEVIACLKEYVKVERKKNSKVFLTDFRKCDGLSRFQGEGRHVKRRKNIQVTGRRKKTCPGRDAEEKERIIVNYPRTKIY